MPSCPASRPSVSSTDQEWEFCERPSRNSWDPTPRSPVSKPHLPTRAAAVWSSMPMESSPPKLGIQRGDAEETEGTFSYRRGAEAQRGMIKTKNLCASAANIPTLCPRLRVENPAVFRVLPSRMSAKVLFRPFIRREYGLSIAIFSVDVINWLLPLFPRRPAIQDEECC